MNEWTLPGPAARTYHALVEQEKLAGRFESRKANLRGGIWRNFFMRYPESNWMHKRMLDASRRLAQLPPALRTAEMQELLHRCQANDAYWHGLFGGLYLPHLRRAIWNNLLALERELDRLQPPPAVERRDLDFDGHEEIFLRDGSLLAVVRSDGDAMVTELSCRGLAHNFGDGLRRYDEGYHDKLIAAQHARADHGAPGDGVASAHDRIAFRHEIGPADAEPDSRARGLFEDCWMPPDGSIRPLHAYRESRPGVFVDELPAGRVEKRYEMLDGALLVHYRTEGIAGHLEIHLNIAMPSCDGYAGRYILEDGRIPCGFGQLLELSAARRLMLDDDVLGGALQITCDPPLAVVARPHRTVSQSEAGFEKVMQAAEVALYWPLAGAPGELTIRLECRRHGA
jgi:hypothetical protein